MWEWMITKKSIHLAGLLPSGELLEWQIANEARAIRRMVKKLHQVAVGEVLCCYEAAPVDLSCSVGWRSWVSPSR